MFSSAVGYLGGRRGKEGEGGRGKEGEGGRGREGGGGGRGREERSYFIMAARCLNVGT